MRPAPAFVMEVCPDPRWERWVRALRGLAWLTLPGWLGWQCVTLNLTLTQPSPELGWRIAATTLLGLVLWLTRSAPTLPQGTTLAWQPAHTGWWQAPSHSTAPSNSTTALNTPHPSQWPVQLSCLCDGGDWLLLRLIPAPLPSGSALGGDTPHAHRSQWLALRQHDHPQHWHRLRCALFTPGL